MSLAAIRVEGLGKMYKIRGQLEPYKTLRDTVSHALAGFGKRFKGMLGGPNGPRESHETIWALKDVTLEVQQGEVMGIIGRNGAGKSTLMKVLSRIAEPTLGRVEIRGKVASLLEVGTGFHPELTGRENVYLNGAIMGMRHSEVQKQFDAIVSFAEVERFIDTPVKHYSSGMYLRLAFAVASHLDADILLVDEVLAVGDATFQKRCMAKMGSVANSGKTVMFVSHNLAAVRELCPWAILIDGGRLVMKGRSGEVIKRYGELVSSQECDDHSEWWYEVSVKYLHQSGHEDSMRLPSLQLMGNLFVRSRLTRGYIIALVENAFGGIVLNRRVSLLDEARELLEPGQYIIRFVFEDVWLAPGTYLAYFKLLGLKEDQKDIRDVSGRALFEVCGPSRDLGRSVLAPPFRWTYGPIQ